MSSTQQLQQRAVKSILSHLSASNDSKWDTLKAELGNYESYLLEQQPFGHQQRPTKPPLIKNGNNATSKPHETTNLMQSTASNSSLNRAFPTKPPMRVTKNAAPLLRLFVRLPLAQQQSKRKEIVIRSKDKADMDEAINKFCNETNLVENASCLKYKEEIRNTILALLI